MRRREALKLFAGLALCPLCASTGFASEGHWSYEGSTGPEKWGSLDAAAAACSAGSQQSPVDITAPVSARQPPLNISWSKRPDTIVNNGHTIQLDFAEGGTLHMGDRQYALKQFHFHHPSEHLIEGKRFAMEVHFVHAGTDGLAVVGVLMVAGKPNAMFKRIVSTMPREEGSSDAADRNIDPGGLLPTERAYYHYEGSLTTPPCSETVDRIVLTHPLEVDEDDIARFSQAVPNERTSGTEPRPALHSQFWPALKTDGRRARRAFAAGRKTHQSRLLASITKTKSPLDQNV